MPTSQMRRLSVSLKRHEAIHATRVSVGNNKLVYVLVADKKLKYPNGKSRIAYIGTTKNGVARIAESVAARSHDILQLRGVNEFGARVVTCKPRQNVKTWHKLERAMLLRFKAMYGDVPHCNTQGAKMKVTDEFRYFSEKGIDTVIEELA